MFDKQSRAFSKSLRMSLGLFFAKLGFSPNAMTGVTLLIGLSAAYSIYSTYFLLSALLVLLSGFTDLLDGAIAKATNRVTPFGGALDSIVDKITEIALYAGFALAFPWLAWVAFLASSGMMWSSYTNQRCKRIGMEKGMGFMQRKERIFLLLVALLALEFNVSAFGVSAALFTEYVLYVIALFCALTGLQRIWVAYKTRRD